MDESLQELENELARLTPRRPSAGFVARLEAELGAAPAPAGERRYNTAASLRSWKWAGWALAGAAGAALLMMVLQLERRPSPPLPSSAAAADRYEPASAHSVLYDMKDDGTAYLPDRSEGRQVRYRYVDTYTWRNPKSNASLRWSVPRDEVRVIPASLN